jgi:phosphoglycolate phosphatase
MALSLKLKLALFVMASKTLKHKTHVIFDFDGTLVNTPDFLTDIFQKIGTELGIELSDKKFDQYRDKSVADLIKEFKIPKTKLIWLKRFIGQELAQVADQLNFNQQIPGLLSNLKQHDLVLGIVSSSPRQNIVRFLQAQQALELFEFVISDRSLFGKHRVLAKLINQKQLDLNSCVYIGDEIRDIIACQKINLDMIAVDWGLNSHQALASRQPSFLASKPREIAQLLV